MDNEDNVYICNINSVKITDKDGKVIITFGGKGTTHGRFSDSPCYSIVYRDQLVVSDTGGRIYCFTKSGEFIKNMASGMVKKARGLTVSLAGDLIIVDEDGPVTVVRDGRAVCRVGEAGGESWHLDSPEGAAVTSTGQVVVVNWGSHNLLLYDALKKI